MEDRTRYVAEMLGRALRGEKTSAEGAKLDALDVNGRINFIDLAGEIHRALGTLGEADE